MAEINAMITGLLIVLLLAVCASRYKLKKDIYQFTENLEEYLDHLLSGRVPKGQSVPQDALWDKIYEKLLRIQKIWVRHGEENKKEKEQIKELISDISHQTKTPIANMKLYLEMLQNEHMEEEKRQEFLTKMGEQTEKLDFLLQSMVKMSRLETGIIEIQKKPLRIQDTLIKAVEAIVPKAEEKRICLYVECSETHILAHDRKWTEEAIFNILDNAVKYTPNGGKIEIHVTKQELFTRISIRDSGKGIQEARQAQIFKRFYREPEVHDQEGIGVGLYLAREIITMQKGYIEVHSREGRGSEFRIYLPNEAV